MALTLTNAEIVLGLPIITDFIEKANDGSTTTVECLACKGLDEEELEGAYICFLDGANAGIDRIITTYTSNNTGTFTFDALPNTVDNTTMFALVLKSFIPASLRAESVMTNDFRNRGLDIDNFLDTTQLKEIHLNRSLAHICFAKRQDADTNDTYHINYEEFMATYIAELNNLTADYDINEDGSISTSEENQKVSQVGFSR
jgi:hypothetical protein